MPITKIYTQIAMIYDKYFEYLPFEKMPINFPSQSDSSKHKKFDLADDLLFIDGMYT